MRTPRRGPSAILATTAWALPLVTLIPLAAPYLALGLEHTRGLQLQAAVILAGVLLVAATGLREGPRAWAARVLAAPRPLLIALACYAAAALWGAAVGLLRGVPPVGIASQLLSMGLLPLAAGAGLGLGSGGEPARRFTLTLWMGTLSMGTLWIGTGAAAALHLGLWLMRAASGASQIRHTVDIEAGVAGPSLLALLLALAFARSAPARGWRVAAGLAALLLGLYQLGTEVRGLWLVTVPAVPLFFLLAGWRPRLWRWGVAAGLLAAAAAGLAWWIHGWLERPRANLLPHTRPAALVRGESVEGLEILGRREHESSRRRVLAWSTGGTELRALPPAVPLGEAGLLRLTTTTWGPAEGTARVGLRWLDARGAALGEAVDEVPGGAQWRRNEMLALPPAGAASAQVVLGAAEPAAGDS